MPCYDKKLEAVRPPSDQMIEVDTVLATHEVLELPTIKDPKDEDSKMDIDEVDIELLDSSKQKE
jgi:iron only hydrogenase large subunit-like protein